MNPRTFIFCSFVLLSAVVVLCVLAENRGLSAHYSAATKSSFRHTLSHPFGSSSISEAFAGVAALLKLGEKIPDKDKSAFCSAAWNELSHESISKANNVATQLSTLYYANQIRSKLACPSTSRKASKAVVDYLLSSVEEAASVSNVFYASTTLLSLHVAKLLPDQPKFVPSDLSSVITHVAEAFASEISIESYGHGLSAVAAVVSAAPSLSNSHSTEIDLVADAIGDALGRGIELDDGSVVFYDAGDSSTAARVTASLLSGIADFAAVKSDIDLPSDLSSTVGDYFVSRAAPTSVSDIHNLLTIVDIISGAQLSNPMALSVSQRSLSSGSKEDLIVTLTDIWGAPLSGGSVYLVAATREGGAALISNQPLAAGTAGEFRLNLLSAKPDAGLYELEFSATAPANSKFSGITSTTRKVQITIPITVSDIDFQLVDSTDNEVSVKRTISENSKLEGDIEGLYFNNLVISLTLRASNAKASKGLTVQQVFVSLANQQTGQQVVFPAQPSGKGYSVTIELRNDGRALNFQSGLYNIRLFVADTFIENPVNRDLGNIKLTFPANLATTPATKAYSSKLPDIQHTFRIPEKRPDPSFSLLFTAITLAPVLYLIIGILSVGFNLSGIPRDTLGLVGTLLLIGSVAAAAFLYFEFFMSLNLFETLNYLGPISLVALVAGKYAFRSRAASRKPKKE